MNFADLLKFDLWRSLRTAVFTWIMMTYLLGSTTALLLAWPGPLRLEDLAAPAAGAGISPTAWLAGRTTFAWVLTIQLLFLGAAAVLLAAAPGWREEDISLQAFAAGAPQTAATWVTIHSLATLGLLVILALAGLPISLVALGTRVLSISTSPIPPLTVKTLLSLLLWAILASAGYLALAIAVGTILGLRFEPPFRYAGVFLFASISAVFAGQAANTAMRLNPFVAVWTAITYVVHPASRSMLMIQPSSYWPAALLSTVLALGLLSLVTRNVRSLRQALWADLTEERSTTGDKREGIFYG